jgi:hypothetical protein
VPDPRDMPIAEQLEYFAAREIWKKRDEMTPSGEGKWRDWFLERFGRSIEDAAKDYGRRR